MSSQPAVTGFTPESATRPLEPYPLQARLTRVLAVVEGNALLAFL